MPGNRSTVTKLRAAALVLVVACTQPAALPSVSSSPSQGVSPEPASSATPDGSASDPSAATWETRAKLPLANSEIAVAELNGSIYVVGGYPSTRVVATSVMVYDVGRDTWRLTTPLPVPLHHTMAAAANGRLYVIGGESGQTAETSAFVNTVYEYDPGTATWRTRAAMPTARSGAATAVIGDRIYVAGGRPPRGSDFAVYDARADAWTRLPDLPTQRNHLAAGALGERILVAGGRFAGGVGGEMTAIVEAFDPRTSVWERLPPMPTARGGVNSAVANGCLYVFGGEGNSADTRGMFGNVEMYDPASGWSKLPPMPTAVHGVTGAPFVNGVIHLVGGGTSLGGSSGSTVHQVLRPAKVCA